jgi:hypothetical protein
MKKALCVLTLLGLVAAVSAEVDVRIWLSTQRPDEVGIVWMPGYGPFTPYATVHNDSGDYDAHQTGYLLPPPQAGSVNGDSAGFPPPPFLLNPASLTVQAPTGLPQGTPVYIYAAFAGTGTAGYPDGMGTAPTGTKINGMNITLVTTGSLALDPHWYQVVDPISSAPYRWESTSDMTGATVTLVGVNATGWQNGNVGVTDLLQAPLTVGRTTGGAILLGAINATGGGGVQVGLEYNGMSSNLSTGGEVVYFPGTETMGIAAGTVPQGTAPRVGATVQASWIPEPASVLLIGLGALLLRRR